MESTEFQRMRDAPVAFRNKLIVGTRPTVGVMIAVIAASASAVVFFVMLKCQSPAAVAAAAATAIGLHQSLSYCLFASLAPGPLKDRHAYRSTQPQSQQHRCSKVKAAENKCTYETNLRSLCCAFSCDCSSLCYRREKNSGAGAFTGWFAEICPLPS